MQCIGRDNASVNLPENEHLKQTQSDLSQVQYFDILRFIWFGESDIKKKSHHSEGMNEPKQNGTQEQTPFSGIVFAAELSLQYWF